jgi:hypothetical protein
MTGFCTKCEARTKWKKTIGWIFHLCIAHERCEDCHSVVGDTARMALAEIKRQFGADVSQDMQRIRHALDLDELHDEGLAPVWSYQAPVVKPPAAPPEIAAAASQPARKRRIMPGPGYTPR